MKILQVSLKKQDSALSEEAFHEINLPKLTELVDLDNK